MDDATDDVTNDVTNDVTAELCSVGYQSEARGIESFLHSQDIDCIVVVNQDTAIPGVSDQNKPWGSIRVREQDLERARELLEEWRKGEPQDIEQAWEQGESEQGEPESE